MKFDAVIIGGGLAGLSCGIRLTQAGLSCAIVSAGQNALHFSSGSLDFLSQLPDGQGIESPLDALSQLALSSPRHPYSRIGKDIVTHLALQAEKQLNDAGVELFGSCEQNHYRITPLGHKRLTWLSPKRVPVVDFNQTSLTGKIAVVGIEGFLDFQPQMVADVLKEQGTDASAHYVHLPLLDRLRENASEFRAINVARWLDRPENLDEIALELTPLVQDADKVFLPACLGLETDAPIIELEKRLGKPIYLLPTLPPSLLGIRLHEHLLQQYRRQGGIIMPGDKVTEVKIVDQQIVELHTRNHGDIPLKAKQFVLATGSFFNNGLVAAFDRVYEPIMGLDLCEVTPRAQWTDSQFFASQPYMRIGVDTDAYLRAKKEGEVIANLYVAGAVLGGFDPLTEGCGAGVSLISGLYAADQIISCMTESKAQAEVAQ